MEPSQGKPNTKRQSESDEPMQFPKIVDLADLCLINIFECLDVQSLLNVANASVRLRPAVFNVYNRKFGVKTVNINSDEAIHAHVGAGFAVQEFNDGIYIHGLKTSLQYLRCFGPLIHGLTIFYGDSSESKRHEYVNEYVNNYCAESLVSISFGGMEDIEQFQKAFANIQDVSFESCNLGEKWPSIVQLFSNLRSLNIDDVGMNYCFVEKPFRNLEHLSIHRLRCDEFKTIKIAADLLDGIQQLKSLEIDESEMSIVDLLNLIKDNPSIAKLSAPDAHGPVASEDVQRLISEHPALTDLNLECCKITPDDVIALTRQLGSLKRFQFYTQVNYNSSERSVFNSQLDGGGWDIFDFDSGCDLRTFRYDMWITINRRA